MYAQYIEEVRAMDWPHIVREAASSSISRGPYRREGRAYVCQARHVPTRHLAEFLAALEEVAAEKGGSLVFNDKDEIEFVVDVEEIEIEGLQAYADLAA